MADYNLEKLFDDLLKKKKFDKKNSYTSTLLTNKSLLAKKLGEESVEVILEYLDNNKNNIIRLTITTIVMKIEPYVCVAISRALPRLSLAGDDFKSMG